MYVPTLGGSGLLHLLAAHPRVVAVFGVAATVTALMAPHAPGRLVGTAGHIERIESAFSPQIAALGEERQTAAEQQAVRLLERNDHQQIELAVRQFLRTCGAACTDISTDRVVSDRALLVRVLMLSELDKLAHTPQANVAGAASHTNRPTGRTN
jgi:hypothetical protein